ncbi:hypothetical protein K8R14_02260 [bacterium]|nr:hypothetical protein [bacterium]
MKTKKGNIFAIAVIFAVISMVAVQSVYADPWVTKEEVEITRCDVPYINYQGTCYNFELGTEEVCVIHYNAVVEDLGRLGEYIMKKLVGKAIGMAETATGIPLWIINPQIFMDFFNIDWPFVGVAG